MSRQRPVPGRRPLTTFTVALGFALGVLGAGSALAQANLAVGDLPAEQTVTIEFEVTVANPLAAGVSQVTNQGSISGTGFTTVLSDDPDFPGATDPTVTPIGALPDLTLTKSDGGINTVPGGTISYALTFANVGDQGATGVAISETVPANTTFNSGASTAGWSCANGSPGGTPCGLALGGLAGGGNGGVATFAVDVVNPVGAGVTQVSNSATIADDGANGADPTPANNTASDTTPVAAQPDLSLTKSDGGASGTPGGTVTYTLTYTNGGNQGATGVALSETVPANSTFNSGASTAGWSCANGSPAGTPCTLAIGALAGGGANGAATFAVTVVNPLPAGVAQISNTGAVADDGANGPDPTPGDNTASDTTPINAQPDLTLTKSDGGASAVPGGAVVYTLTYANAGDQAATGVAISDTVPAGTTFNAGASTVGWSCANGSPAGTPCTLAIGALGGGGAGGAASFVVNVLNPVPAGLAQLSNTATIADDGANGADPTPGNNTGADTTPLDATPDLAITKSDGGASGTPGGTVTYTLSYANNGNQGATGVTISETVPADSTFNAGASTAGWSCANGSPAGTPCTLAVGALAGGGANGSASFAVTVVNPLPAGVTQLSNTATIADDGANGADPTPGDNSATDTTPITAAPDLTIAKSDGGATATPGGTVGYTLSYANAGNQGATGVVISETVPTGSTFNAGASTAGWSCADASPAGTPCTLAVGALAGGGANGTATFTVNVLDPVPPGLSQLSNTATIADDGANGADPNPGDNSSTDTTPLTGGPDLQLTKSDGGATSVPGGAVTYTLGYTNAGNRGASGVTLSETVPANAAFSSAGSTAGWSCANGSPAGTPCTLAVGSLAGGGANGSATFAVTVVNPLPAGVGQLSNTATIADDGANGADPNPGDNTATDTTPIDAVPDLTLAKSDGGVSVAAGGVVTYTLSYANAGNQGASGVVLSETVPVDTTFVAASSTAGWSCADGSPAGTPCTLAVGGLAGGGANGTASFAVRVVNPVPGGFTQVDNTATIADDGANGADPNPGDNSASDSTPVTAVVDLVAVKSVVLQTDADGNGLPSSGDTLRYTVTVTNNGGQDASGVMFDDTFDTHTAIPANNLVTTTQGTVTSGDTAGDTTVGVDLGTLPGAGGSATITFDVTIDPGVIGGTVISNQGSFSGSNFATVQTDGDPGSPGSSEPTTITVGSISVIEIPTLDDLGLALLVLLLAGLGLWRLRRRRGAVGLAVGLALLGAAAPARAVVTVDSFATAQALLQVPPGTTTSSTVSGAGILGTERDLVVNQTSGAGAVSAQVTGGALVFSAAAATTGQAVVTWDGVDGNATVLNPTGLGGVDLTSAGADTGLAFTVNSAGAGAQLLVEVYTNAGNASHAGRALPAIGSPTTVVLSFASDFLVESGTGADFANVGAVVLTVIGTNAALTLDAVQTTPPAVSSTKVDTLAVDNNGNSQANPGDTLRYRITIHNSGGGTTGVNLADAIDPNLALVAGSLRSTPIAAPDTYATFGNLQLVVNGVSLPSVLANDSDPDGDPVALDQPGSDTTSLQGGNVAWNPDGTFTYNPPAGFKGVDSFSYALVGNAGDPAVGTIHGRVTVLVDKIVWFVDNDATGPVFDGRFATPFLRLTDAQTAAAPGDIIYVFQDDGTSNNLDAGIVLKDGQELLGQGVDLVLAGQTLVTATSAPHLTNTAGSVVTLANSNTVRGVVLRPSTGAGLLGSAVGGSTAVSDVAIELSGSGGGVSLTNQGGSFSFSSNTSISGSSSGTAVTLSGGAATFSFAGTPITKTGGRLLNASGTTGGSVDFTGAALSISGGNGTAISLVNNTGNTVLSSLGSVATTAGAGIVTSNAGTVNFGSGASVNAAGGAALDLATTTLGGGATFLSLASTGAATGVNLNTVTGALSVSGSTTVTASGPAVSLQSSGAVSFNVLSATATAGTALLASGNGLVTVSGGTSTLGATGGPAVDASTTNFAATFATASSSGSPTRGLRFNASSGSFVANGGAIGTATGAAVEVTGGNGTITYAGSVTNTAGRSVQVTARTGGGVTLSGNLNDTGTGVFVDSNTGGTVTLSGGTKTVSTGTNNAVTATNNGGATTTFSGGGLAVTTTSGIAFVASGGGTVNVSGASNTLSASAGKAIDLNGVTTGITFASISSVGSPSQSVNLTNLATGSSFTVTGTTTADNPAAANVNINISGLTTGSTLSFGKTDVLRRKTTGVLISGSAGTIGFGATTVPNPNTSGGYGIEVTGSSAAVTFASTTISNAHTLVAETYNPADPRDLPTNDGDGDGIFLKTNTGSFTSNGGTISASNSNALDMRSVSNVTLANVTIDGSTDSGIQGITVNGFTFRDSVLQNFGNDVSVAPANGVTDSGMRFRDLSGTATIQRSMVKHDTGFVLSQFPPGIDNNGIEIFDVGVNLTMNVTGSTFFQLSNQAILASGESGTVNLNVDGSTADGANSFSMVNGLTVYALQEAVAGTMNLTVKNSTFNQIGIAVQFSTGLGGSTTATITGNTISNTVSSAIIQRDLSSTVTPSTIRATISSNTISGVGTFDAAFGGRAVDVQCEDGVNARILVNANNMTVTGNQAEGIRALARRQATMSFVATNNTLATADFDGIRVQSQDGSGAGSGPSSSCTHLAGNTVTGGGMFGTDYTVAQQNTSTLLLQGFAGGAGADTFIDTNNTGADTVTVVGTIGAGPVGGCLLPP